MTNEIESIPVSWVVSENAVQETISEIEDSKGLVTASPVQFNPPPDELEDYHDAQFDPLLIIASAVGIGFLIKRISDIWLDHTRPGGQILDTRNKELVIRPAPHIPRDSLLVITNEKSELYLPGRKDEALAALTALAKNISQ